MHPMTFKDATVELREVEFNGDSVGRYIQRMVWKALVKAARVVRRVIYCEQVCC